MKQPSQIDISIVIVNYKVKEFIANLLVSIKKASKDYTIQIFVVDNNSEDGSVEYLRKNFPYIKVIDNKINLGFGKANNQAIKEASGTYTLIINPDTLVSEDTFSVFVSHMEKNAKCGAAGCKLLNPDGTFAPESKRSVPTVWSAICTVLGLHYIFPKSQIFAPRYLGWIDEDSISEVPVISGACMFWRTDLLKELGGFDERFFMYAEDDDLCFRTSKTAYRIDYVPKTSIIHYKGESATKGDLRHIRIFSKALYQFFEKHYGAKYKLFFKSFIISAIWFRAILSWLTYNIKLLGSIAKDLIILNLSVTIGFLIRFEFSYEVFTSLQNLKYLWINLLASVLYIGIGASLEIFNSRKESISTQLKAIISSFLGVALITFFVRDLAFSRLALIFGLIAAILLVLTNRLISINRSKNGKNISGKLKRSNIFLVGSLEDTELIKAKINARPDWNYEVVGVISPDITTDGYLGALPQLKDLAKAYNIDQVFFALKSISYKDMLGQISKLQSQRVLIKLIPDSMDFILGKSNVEYLESIPLVEVDFAYNNGLNRILKRALDIVLTVPLLLFWGIFSFPASLLSSASKKTIASISFYQPLQKHRHKNRVTLFWNILTGNLSWVGAPVFETYQTRYSYKKGVCGLVQLNEDKIRSESDCENYELYYLQNYSIWMDIDILIKSLVNRYSFFPETPDQK